MSLRPTLSPSIPARHCSGAGRLAAHHDTVLDAEADVLVPVVVGPMKPVGASRPAWRRRTTDRRCDRRWRRCTAASPASWARTCCRRSRSRGSGRRSAGRRASPCGTRGLGVGHRRGTSPRSDGRRTAPCRVRCGWAGRARAARHRGAMTVSGLPPELPVISDARPRRSRPLADGHVSPVAASCSCGCTSSIVPAAAAASVAPAVAGELTARSGRWSPTPRRPWPARRRRRRGRAPPPGAHASPAGGRAAVQKGGEEQQDGGE